MPRTSKPSSSRAGSHPPAPYYVPPMPSAEPPLLTYAPLNRADFSYTPGPRCVAAPSLPPTPHPGYIPPPRDPPPWAPAPQAPAPLRAAPVYWASPSSAVAPAPFDAASAQSHFVPLPQEQPQEFTPTPLPQEQPHEFTPPPLLPAAPIPGPSAQPAASAQLLPQWGFIHALPLHMEPHTRTPTYVTPNGICRYYVYGTQEGETMVAFSGPVQSLQELYGQLGTRVPDAKGAWAPMGQNNASSYP